MVVLGTCAPAEPLVPEPAEAGETEAQPVVAEPAEVDPEEPDAPPPSAEAPEDSDTTATLTDEEFEEIIAERTKDTTPRSPAEPDEPTGPVRRGVMATLGLGYAGCSKDWCRGYRGGIGGMVELGVRLNRIMPLVSWHGGAGPYDRETLNEEFGLSTSGSRVVKMNTFGAGLWLFPLGKDDRIIDPHFGLRLGYGTVKMAYRIEDISIRERLRRGVATIGGGIDGFVTDHLSVGARADMHIMFGGEYCFSASNGSASAGSCAQSDDAQSRADPRDWPLPFSVLLQMRYTWAI